MILGSIGGLGLWGRWLGRWRYGMLAMVVAVVLCLAWVGLPTVTLQANAQAANNPQAVVNQFYQWYVQNQSNYRRQISQQRAVFEPDFYQQLVSAFQRQPSRDGRWLDFDPFSDTQVSSYRAVVRTVKRSEYDAQEAEVDIDVYAGLRPPGTPVPIKVLVTNRNNRWQIRNLVYMKSWNNLMCYLREINR